LPQPVRKFTTDKATSSPAAQGLATSVVKPTPSTSNKTFDPKSQVTPLYAVREYDMNVDDYAITGSPAIIKLSQDETVGREVIKKYAEHVVAQMLSEGYCVIDDFLGEAKSGKVLWDVTTICRSGIMKAGQVIVTGKNDKENIRGDLITWITGQEEAYENMKLIMNDVDRLIRYCAGSLGNIKGRTPVSFNYCLCILLFVFYFSLYCLCSNCENWYM